MVDFKKKVFNIIVPLECGGTLGGKMEFVVEGSGRD
jgi:hypothetical protein